MSSTSFTMVTSSSGYNHRHAAQQGRSDELEYDNEKIEDACMDTCLGRGSEPGKDDRWTQLVKSTDNWQAVAALGVSEGTHGAIPDPQQLRGRYLERRTIAHYRTRCPRSLCDGVPRPGVHPALEEHIARRLFRTGHRL